MIEFGMIGTGWRAEFFLRIARACPERFKVTGLVYRSADKGKRIAERFGVPAYASLDELLQAGRPQFVVVSVSRGAALPILARLAELEIPALLETPAGEALDDMTATWRLAEQGARIQVAEQYWAQPHHAARLAFVHSGKLGSVTQAQVSVAHGYHGISLIRRFLGVQFEPVTVTATSFTAPIVEGPGRSGLPDREAVIPSQQVFARFDFGDRLGLYDFTGDQYFSFIRGQRVLVRGERGEIVDDKAVYLSDFRTPIHVRFERQSAGLDGNLEGNYLKGIQVGEHWGYTNPLAPGEMSDEEIAIGTCLLRMGEYSSGSPDFYSLAEGLQDRYLDLLMEQALASGQTVTSQPQPWQH